MSGVSDLLADLVPPPETLQRRNERAPSKARAAKEAAHPELVAADATHHDIAVALLNRLTVDGHAPVCAEGGFYSAGADELWHERTIESLQVLIAEEFNGCKHCKRNTDYKQIADHVCAMVEDSTFFSNAPVGVTTPSGFYTLGEDSRVRCVPLTLAHRQRFMIRWDPDFDAEPTRINEMLEAAFEGDSPDEQVDLVWQTAGCALFQLLARHQLALMLLGREGSGKSTWQRVLESVFPASAVSAVSPAVWSREYNVASLAGKLLNVVGELSDDAPIPAAAFKNVTGNNLIEGRHPTHRPFYFVCKASHVFASNVLPPTTDRTEAFFRRWRILRFKNRVAADRVDPDLLAKILDEEMPAFLAYAFRGAERVAEARRVRTTPAHDSVLAKWKAAANPVLQFLLDSEWVELDPEIVVVKTRDAYATYRKWAADVGMRNPFGRNHFLDLVDSSGASIGVGRRKSNGQDVVAGIRLLERDLT